MKQENLSYCRFKPNYFIIMIIIIYNFIHFFLSMVEERMSSRGVCDVGKQYPFGVGEVSQPHNQAGDKCL